MTTPRAIGLDALCVRCGYSLHGLTGEACPECGLAIERSFALGEQLRDSRPAWIRSLAWASILLLIAQLTPVVAGLVGAAAAAGDWLPQAWRANTLEPELLLVQGIFLLGTLIHFAACWMLTRPENPYAAIKPSARLALGLRLCSAGLVMVFAACIAGAFLLPVSQLSFHDAWLWAFLFGVMLPLLLFLPCPLLQFILLRRLALRVLSEHLISHTTIVGVGYPASAVAFAGLTASPLLGLDSPDSRFGFLLFLAILTSALLFWIWSMYAFLLCAIAFRRAARQASSAWQQADRSATAG